MADKLELLNNVEKIHTTPMGTDRIRKNLGLTMEDVVGWCKEKILLPAAEIVRRGKNWYVTVEGCVITVNAFNYCIITAHKEKKNSTGKD